MESATAGETGAALARRDRVEMTAGTDEATEDHRTRRSLAIPVGAAWAVLAVLMAVIGFDDDGFRWVDSDDLMRLVQVRDLLAGQPWFDLVQHRLGPQGVVMHWSRLVDAPIAGLILLLSPVLGAEAAERGAMIAWPLLLGLSFLSATAVACRAFGGRLAMAFGLLLAIGLALQSLKFVPGAIDHHNVQMVVVATALAGLLARRHAGGALLSAGVAGALSLGVGVEAAPQVGAVGLAVALLWAGEGREADRRTLLFAAGFAGSLTLAYLLATPPANRFSPLCDVLSEALFMPALIGATGLGALAAGGARLSPRLRVLGILALGAAVLALAASYRPGCLTNPLDSLDPLLQQHWLANVAETRGVAEVLAVGWDQYLGVYLVPLLALAYAVGRTRGSDRGSALALILLILVSYAATLYQLRGMFMLGLVSIPALAAGLAGLYGRYREQGSAAYGVGTLLALLAALPLAWGLVPVVRSALQKQAEQQDLAGAVNSALATNTGNRGSDLASVAAKGGGRRSAEVEPVSGAADQAGVAAGPAGAVEDCHAPALYAGLAGLPQGRVSASSNLGAPVLAMTPHAVLAAPYHRNQAGMLAQLRIAMASPGEAPALLARHGVDYLVVCTADREYDWLRHERPDSLFARLSEGAPPDWLVPLTPPGSPLAIYREQAEAR